MDDWYAWLSRAGLGEDLAAEYAVLFERNELGAADLRHLDHAFLATMGVAVAKHRLEILKLARKESSSATIAVLPWRATRLLAAATHRSVRSMTGRLRSAAARRDRRAAVAPRPLALCQQQNGVGGSSRVAAAGPARWKSAPTAVDGPGATRRKLAAFLTRVGKPMLTLTNTSGKEMKEGAAPATRRATTIAAACFSSTEASRDYDADDDDDEEEQDDGGGEDPETPWESMFQNLNPT